MRDRTSSNAFRKAEFLSGSDDETLLAWPWIAKDWGGQEARTSLPLVVVTIPCLNEERTIASVIRRVPREVPGVAEVRILVIDDGSEDDTPLVAVRAGADAVIRHKTILGLGRTFGDGLDAGLRMGADIIVNVDADGQYDPSELPHLLRPILCDQADIVLGNRQVDSLHHMRWSRKWGNRVASWVTRRVSGLDIRDSQTGFRAISRDAAVRLTLSGRYTYTQEMIIEAAYRGFAVEEIPITFKHRSYGSSRLISNAWHYGLRAGGIILRSYLNHNPLKVFALMGAVVVGVGGLVGSRAFLHYLGTGMVSPFLPSAILAAILGVVGFQLIIFGLLADMVRTHRKLTEELLFRIRKREDLSEPRKF